MLHSMPNELFEQELQERSQIAEELLNLQELTKEIHKRKLAGKLSEEEELRFKLHKAAAPSISFMGIQLYKISESGGLSRIKMEKKLRNSKKRFNENKNPIGRGLNPGIQNFSRLIWSPSIPQELKAQIAELGNEAYLSRDIRKIRDLELQAILLWQEWNSSQPEMEDTEKLQKLAALTA